MHRSLLSALSIVAVGFSLLTSLGCNSQGKFDPSVILKPTPSTDPAVVAKLQSRAQTIRAGYNIAVVAYTIANDAGVISADIVTKVDAARGVVEDALNRLDAAALQGREVDFDDIAAEVGKGLQAWQSIHKPAKTPAPQARANPAWQMAAVCRRQFV